MTAYVLRRVLSIIPVLLAIAAVTFLLMHAMPGSPCGRDKPLTPPACANLKAAYGLDQPLWQQFGFYLVNLAQGDLGVSSHYGERPVREVLADGFRVSATLGGLALAVSVTAGVGLGVVSALRRNTAVDYLTTGFTTIAASVPSFILGMLLLVLFVGKLHWLPTGGWGSPKEAIMPVLALSALPTAYIARVTRASMLETLGQDYVRTARAKGLNERVVVLRHMLRNALLPVLNVIGPVAAALVTGSFIVEHLFSVPGIGRAYFESIAPRDYAMIMATTLLYAVAVVVANLVVDVVAALFDPRVRRSTYG
ncbi:MAG: ABC transporter permease [Dehalococcoidia bacterium]